MRPRQCRDMNSYRIPPWFGLALLFTAGCFAFVLPVWIDAIVALGRKSGISESWAGFAGNLIGSALTSIVAAIAIYFAYIGIRQQIRAGVLAREEDRILRELPGLRDALELLTTVGGTFTGVRSVYGIRDQFRELGFSTISSMLSRDLKTLLPDTDDASFVQVRRAVSAAIDAGVSGESKRSAADAISARLHTPEEWDKTAFTSLDRERRLLRDGASHDMDRFIKALSNVDLLAKELGERIDIFEKRLPRLRRAMSEYFDR